MVVVVHLDVDGDGDVDLSGRRRPNGRMVEIV